LGTGRQVPRVLGRAQLWQVPAQGVWQQTPWAQIPEAQSLGVLAEQGPPSGILPQLES
jgi:hypothetical protein